MNDIGKKLIDGEHYLPGLPTVIYELARYIAPEAMGNVTPEQIVLLIAVAKNDIATGRFTLSRYKVQPYLQSHRYEALERIEMILLLIDAITKPGFAMKVRDGYYQEFG